MKAALWTVVFIGVFLFGCWLLGFLLGEDR
jgi:hypothetical protein